MVNHKNKLSIIGFLILPAIILGVDLELVRAYKNPRVKAFLDMIAYAEGTAHDLGYRTNYTGKIFNSFTDHPRTVYSGILNGKTIRSSAAGRYQFLTKTWDEIAPRIQVCDFSPLSQDYGALELIRNSGALEEIKAGRIGRAIIKVNKIWASLEGSPYGQPTKSIAQLKKVFMDRLLFYQQRMLIT